MSNKNRDIILRNGRPVWRELYDVVRYQVEDALPHLEPGERYTTEQLCGAALWQCLSPVDCRRAGGCLAHLVANGSIGLVFAPSKQKWPRLYMLPPEQPRLRPATTAPSTVGSDSNSTQQGVRHADREA